MAFVRSMMQPKTNKITKKRTIGQFFNGGKKKLAIGAMLLVAAIGAYYLFFAGASPNNCTSVYSYQDPNLYGTNEQTAFRKIEKMPTKGKLINLGGICDVDQASNNEDSVFSTNEEAYNLGKNGWLYWGTAFRLPNFQQGNSKPLERVFYAPLSIHALMFDGTDKDTLVKNGAQREFVLGYAWEQEGQPGTVPVYRYERASPFAQNLYTTEKSQGDSWVANDKDWQFKGVAFYAYPPNYLPPLPPEAPKPATIDSDCDNQTLKRGDSGECVKMLKDVMLGIGYSGDLDKNDPNFDERLNNLTAFAIKGLQNLGKTKTDYLNQVTPEINGILKTALNEKLNPPVDSTSKCPGDIGRQLSSEEQKKFFEEYKDGVNNQKKTYSKECHALWITYGQNQSSTNKSQQVTNTPTSNPTTKPESKIDPCPKEQISRQLTVEEQDQGLFEYVDGVNNKGKNYSKSCHALWLAYAQSKGGGELPDAPPPPVQAPAKNFAACPDFRPNPEVGYTSYVNGVNGGLDYEDKCDQFWWTYAGQRNLCQFQGGCPAPAENPPEPQNVNIKPKKPSTPIGPPRYSGPKGLCSITDDNRPVVTPLIVLEPNVFDNITREQCIDNAQYIRISNPAGKARVYSEYRLAGGFCHQTAVGNTFKMRFEIDPTFRKDLQIDTNKWPKLIHRTNGSEACYKESSQINGDAVYRYNINNIHSKWYN